MSSIIVVGYRTRPVGNVLELMPAFKAPSHWKDPEKINSSIEEQKQQYLKNAKDAPYTGTFDCVFMLDIGEKKVMQWDYREPGAGKSPISVAVRNYLTKTYPTGWEDKVYDTRNPPFRVVGFNPRRFLKILGLECSLPSVNKPLPPRMWYNNQEHRDIVEAVLPRDFEKLLDLPTVLKQRRPDGDARKKWDEKLNGWEGPHQNPEADAWLTVELCKQLGIIEGDL